MLVVLAADHQSQMQMLAEFDDMADGDAGARRDLVLRVGRALAAHAAAAEEVFYPAVRQVLGDDDLVDDMQAGHDGLRALVEQIELLHADAPRFDALVMMLARAVARHAAAEQAVLFPRMRAAGLDLESPGRRFVASRDRVQRLLTEEEGAQDRRSHTSGAG